MSRPEATVVIVTRNSEGLIEPVLNALLSDPERPIQVVVVDNASTDDTVSVVRRFDVHVVQSPDNLGFAGGCHMGVAAATQPTLVFLGHDTEPIHGWLPPLLESLEDPTIGAAMATIEDAGRPGRFNTSGGHLTYFGLAWVSDSGEPIPAERGLIDVAFPSGAAMAIREEVWEAFGGFRKGLFMYHEDTDLGWRLRLAALRVVRLPESRVRHHYEFSRHPRKLIWLERNRLLMVLSNYRKRTVWVLAPALLFVELGVVAVAIRHGWLRAKVRSWREVWSTRHDIPTWRADVARIRRVSDAAMLSSMDYRVSTAPQMSPAFGARAADVILCGYRRLALRVVRLLDRLD